MERMLVVSVQEDGASAERLEQAGDLLRDELLELEVDSVRRLTAGEAPPGTRGVDLAAVGGLLINLPTTPPMLAAVVDVVRNWLRRSADHADKRSVHLEIDGDVLELSQVTADEQSRLIDDWLRRRGNNTEANGDGGS